MAKRYAAGVVAVDDVSLRVAHGSRVAITGPSGSGKSTLLNLIGGLEVATAGSVVVDGTDLGTLDESGRSRWRRAHVAFVFQAYHLLPTLTCADNVALALHVLGLPRQEIEARVSQTLADVGLTPRATHLPDELSGGERQRAAIARALATDPPLLLADEPTGNLDSAAGEQVLALLLDATRRRGAALVLVTHDHAAARRCERVVTLRDGRIEHEGPA